MADTAGTPSSRVTPFWAILWLVAVFVIGITASVVLHNYQLVDTQPTARLTGMLLIGEVLLYFIVLMVPAEGIVPPGRTLLVVLVAMGGRALMAMGAAEVTILTGAQAGFQQLWLDFYTGFWLAALVQMLMIFVYLWLIRSALEVSRPSAPVPQQRSPEDMDYSSEFRIPTPPTDEHTRQRQEQLLSALMENPEAPVEETDEAAEQEPAPDHPAEAVPPDAEAAPKPETQEPPEMPPSPEPEATEPEPEQAELGQMTMDLSEPHAPEEAEDEAGESTDSLPPVPALLADEQVEPASEEFELTPGAGAGLSSEQDMALRAAASNVVEGETVATALSGTGCIYGLIGLAPLPADTSLLDSLDSLFAALMAGTQAIHAGSPKSLVLMTDAGTLVSAASRDCASQILIRGGADAKLGQLSLLAHRARDAAANLDLGNECRAQPIEQAALPPEEFQSRQASDRTGQQVLAFTGSTYSILTTAPAVDAAIVAAAAECAYDAAGVVAEAMQLGAIDRILVEGDGAGLVVGPCDAAMLLVIPAEATAKMGAANIALTKLREALRGEV